jgi:hypothetical protein
MPTARATSATTRSAISLVVLGMVSKGIDFVGYTNAVKFSTTGVISSLP